VYILAAAALREALPVLEDWMEVLAQAASSRLRGLVVVVVVVVLVVLLRAVMAVLVVMVQWAAAVVVVALPMIITVRQAPAAMVVVAKFVFTGGKEINMRAAQLNENNEVINYAEVASYFGPFVDPKDSVMGSIYNPATGDFSQPIPATPVIARHITQLAFRNRFTKAEKVAIDMAAIDDPNAPEEMREQQAELRVSLADSMAASYIDLDRQDTREGVETLEAFGILAPGRAAQILDNPVQEVERPKA
jgi:hypothetical protein